MTRKQRGMVAAACWTIGAWVVFAGLAAATGGSILKATLVWLAFVGMGAVVALLLFTADWVDRGRP